MTKMQQRKAVKEILSTIEDRILQEINKNKIPEWWDGLEFKRFIMYRIDCTIPPSVEYRDKSRFNNDIIDRNL
jgi:hypothetical protein